MESFEEHYASMCDAIKKHLPGADMALIDRAVDYANQKHKVQKRKDGSPYIIHPLAVAQIVAEMGLDCDAILGALLHDCIEDTDASHEDIEKIFGPTVAELVEGVTKLTRANFSSSEEAADGESAQDVHGHEQGHPGGADQNRRPAAQHAHHAVPDAGKADSANAGRPWTSTRPLPTALACRRSSGSWRIPLCATSTPMEYNEIMSLPSGPQGEGRGLYGAPSRTRSPERLTAVGIHNTTYGPDQARLLHLPQDVRPGQDH